MYGMGINDRIFSVKGPYVGGDLTVWGKKVVGIDAPLRLVPPRGFSRRLGG